jgi:hypothetical protein
MKTLFGFGETVEGYNIPVLNEREIRAGAGILFLLMFTSIMIIGFKDNYLLFKYAITIFLMDISIRIFVSPRFSPILILGRLAVRNQNPEYVGAPQKKVAWILGFVLSSIVFVLMVLVNAFSPISGLICMTCLIFLFFETAFGICIGCKLYALFMKDKAQYCPGEVCDIQTKHAIQKTSKKQILVVIVFIGALNLLVSQVNTFYSVPPYDLFGLEERFESK